MISYLRGSSLPKSSLLPELLLNLWSQVQQIFYEEDSVERKHVSRVVHDKENKLQVSHLCFAIAATTSGLQRSLTRTSIMEEADPQRCSADGRRDG